MTLLPPATTPAMVIMKTDMGYCVRFGERYEDGLGWDEALGCVASWLASGKEIPYLRTPEQHLKWENWLNRDKDAA